MMTFSVNKNGTYSKRVLKLLEQLEQGKEFSDEFLSDMYMKAVDGEYIKDISIYSKEIEKISLLARAREQNDELPILTPDEVTNGYNGISDLDFCTDYDIVEKEASKSSLVDQFLDIRENLHYVLGVDIYRLLALIEDDDFVAKQKLDAVVAEFPNLKVV